MFFDLEILPENLKAELRLEDATRSIMREIPKYLPTAAREVIDESAPAGKTYPKSIGEGFRSFIKRSAKGQAPAKDSFELYNSFRAKLSGDLEVTFEMASHAQWLDPVFGGYLDRPFLEESLDRSIIRAMPKSV